MSINFKRFSLSNFGPYRGEQHLELSTTSAAPVILIHGENTLGKTQLFSALRWCLYGTFTPQQTAMDASRELPEHLNNPARRAGEDSLHVSIIFEAEGDTYTLTRRATIDGAQSEESVDLRIGATVFPEAGIEAEIGRLLHPQISEFFLFDAELMKRFYDRLASDRERAFIKASIEAVLGIPALQRAQRDVQDLANDALQRQAKAAKSVSEAKRIQHKMSELKSEADSIARDRAELNEQARQAQAELQDVRERLKVVESLQADVREQELLEAGLADGRREEAELQQELRDLLSAGWASLALNPLLAALSRVQEQNSKFEAHEEAIAAARTRAAVLEDRSRGGDCPACKQALPPPDAQTAHELAEAQEHLDQLRAKAGGGRLDLALERRISALLDEQTVPAYQRKQRRLNELQILQYERKQALEAISDRLQGNKAADIRALALKSRALESAIGSIEKSQRNNERRSNTVAADWQKLAKQLGRLPGARPEVVLEAGFFRYVDDVLGATVDEYRERVRAHVESDAQEMFLNLIRDPAGYGGLRISPDYKIELLDNHNEQRPTSEGGKQLLALALIGALKKAAVRGGPVVLDSPLARLDLPHRANVLKTWIPSLGAQAILLVQSGELTPPDASDLLGGLIGHSYQISRPTADPEYAVIEKLR